MMKKISYSEVRKLLGEQFCSGNNISEKTKYEILRVNATELINAKRIDLVAKYKYIEAFTHGSCVEPGNPQKAGVEKYRKIFEEILSSMRQRGFDDTISLIPVGADFEVLDGAHRAACAIYLGIDVTVIRFPDIHFDFGYNYFQDELLPDVFLNYMLTEYCRLKENVFVANIWPSTGKSEKKKELIPLFERYGGIIAYQNIDLTYTGYRNYMLQIYSKHDWVGNFNNHFRGVMSKVDPCYAENTPLQIIIFECDSINKVLRLKEDVRALFNIGNHSIHISDDSRESLQMLELLLNQNSLHVMNHVKSDDFEQFSANMQILKEKQISEKERYEKIIISDAVLSIYGVRDSEKMSMYNWHNDKSIQFQNEFQGIIQSVDEYIFNPSKYGFIHDYKFICAQDFILLKMARGLEGDVEDSEKLEDAIKSFGNVQKLGTKQLIRRRMKIYERKIVSIASSLARKFHIYNGLRKIYRKVR